jgi:hypothetical protein
MSVVDAPVETNSSAGQVEGQIDRLQNDQPAANGRCTAARDLHYCAAAYYCRTRRRFRPAKAQSPAPKLRNSPRLAPLDALIRPHAQP